MQLLGYVPDYLAADLAQLVDHEAPRSVFVEQVNLPPASLHHRLLCRLDAGWPDGSVPFQGDRFQPLEPQPAPAAQAGQAP
jgi:hypothetical protein